ncbi:VWFA domain-containing protein [Planctomycetales bacterium 10988]|nr:VWFA domain-containing protein [Planctomycetales bacterium 10988]
MKAWIEQLFGLKQTAGEAIEWQLEAPGAWPAGWVFVFAAVAIAFVIYIYRREGQARTGRKILLATLRIAAIAIAVMMIFQLQIHLQRTRLPNLVLLVDDSASMSEADLPADFPDEEQLLNVLAEWEIDSPTRLNQAKSILLQDDQNWLKSLEENFKVQIYSVSTSLQKQWETGEGGEAFAEQIKELQPTGKQSRLGDSIRQVLQDLRGTPPSAIILMSDGITTEGESPGEVARFARVRGVSLFTVGMGSTIPEPDLALSQLLVDEVVFVNDIIYFELTLMGSGLREQEEVIVSLREKQNPDEALAMQTITVGPGETTLPITLPYRPQEVGEYDFFVEVEAVPGERRLENNRLPPQRVSVREERIRVLLVDSQPRFEFRYLKTLLERDRTIELATLLQGADPEYAENDRSALRVLPVAREEIFSYDVILFGDLNPALLSREFMQTLVDFVGEKGGGLVFLGGPRYLPQMYRDSPLAEILPISVEGLRVPEPGENQNRSFPVAPTDIGWSTPFMQLGDSRQENQDIWSEQLYPLRWYQRISHLKPASRVLAEHPTESGPEGQPLPLMILQFYGGGIVLYHAIDETYLWRYQVGDTYFARYWLQAIRYLSRTKLLGQDAPVELATDREVYEAGEPVTITARFADTRSTPQGGDAAMVILERENSKIRVPLTRTPANAQVFEGVYREPVPGNYHLWLASPSLPGNPPATDFLVEAPQSERQELQLDENELKRAAQDTGGQYYTLATVEDLLGDLPPGRRVPDRSEPPIPIWNWWGFLLLFLLLVTCEWILRKRSGML